MPAAEPSTTNVVRLPTSRAKAQEERQRKAAELEDLGLRATPELALITALLKVFAESGDHDNLSIYQTVRWNLARAKNQGIGGLDAALAWLDLVEGR